MNNRIEIVYTVRDSRAEIKKKFLQGLNLDGFINNLQLVDVYTIQKSLKPAQTQKIAANLTNPVYQKSSLNMPIITSGFNWAFETGFLPGVTDNIAATTKEMISDLLKVNFRQNEGVYTSQLLLVSGNLNKEDIANISASLVNPLIQRVHCKSYRQYIQDLGMDKIVPRVLLITKPKVDKVSLDVADDELIKIGTLGIQNKPRSDRGKDGTRRGPLALDLTYMKTIQKHFKVLGRNPTDIELESIAQTWSEHCKHTIFADPIDEIKNGLFNSYIKKATQTIRKRQAKRDFCVSVFKDNSGAIDFDKNYLITHKVETHNSPSALDPFGGSITGIVGVNRDTIGFGLGAKPIANTYGFCFASPTKNISLYKGSGFTQKMLSSRRILDGVVAGVNSGGNCSGIPTPQGFVNFDERYRGKPLVFVGTVGIIPKVIARKKAYLKRAEPGDLIVVIGGRVGLDGIHGATFSSVAMDTNSPAAAVQIGDPITQKKLSDALVKEARDKLLYHSITDNGAGGLSCSVAEMAKEAGGSIVDLENVPLKYPGLAPWQIWISESQERMTLAVPKPYWKEFKSLMDKRGVEATIIGVFTKAKKCVVKFKGRIIMDLNMNFLHNGLPPKKMITQAVVPLPRTTNFTQPQNLESILIKMLARENITSFEFISSQYDHEVQATSVLKPLVGKGRVNGDTSVIRPLPGSPKGLLLSQGLYPQYSDLDCYGMASCAIDTAVRNVVATGADPQQIALLDNFCWCSSTDPQRLSQLRKAAQACFDIAIVYGTPFISGKDSMFNDFKGFDSQGKPVKISVPPTLLISSIAPVADIQKVVSLDFKNAGDLIYLLGTTEEHMGASEYFLMQGFLGNTLPHVSPHKFLQLYLAVHKAIHKQLVASSIGVSRGGLGIALAKMVIAGQLGAQISLKKISGRLTRDDFALFSESMGRILISVNSKNKKAFTSLMKGLPVKLIGTVVPEPKIVIQGLKEKTIINLDLKTAEKAYKSTFKGY